ncbi:DUF2339 domain-containing protein [Sphingosinicella rhizophila]|uniref:DUF2339 domain-containing protein n=1 Tax=Sphingosinicella rhizophila TaxID=3050082 RepID=A0ABU3QCZ2_9SPHN|nr:DUF2339 domain-containing protein [Sphingosinicella sp. GR2756]MDT9601009.1 DUF2339 domain-containing protein [Sphingosinicella sp. GR2756]
MELILFLGLVVLYLFHRQLVVRIGKLEDEMHILRGEPAITEADDPAGLTGARVIATVPHARPARPSWAETVPAAPDADADPAAKEPVPAVRETLATLFERFVGGRLLIWIGGIALAVAGIFLVRYSIEIGIVTPPVRMVVAALFGILLLGAGQYARSRSGAASGRGESRDNRPDGQSGASPTGDLRTAQALVGAGILILYATPYGALVLYQLISIGTASALMLAVTAVALILSLRHGAPTAIMGLAGGFATPFLVGDPDSGAVPLLFYLALLDMAIFVIAQRRGWTWLMAGALLLSFGWTGALLFGRPADALAAGLFVLALSVAGSLVRTGAGWQIDFLRPALIGLLQLALLVARTDIELPAWTLFGALALASLFLSSRKAEYRALPLAALVLALVLLAVKAFAGSDPIVPWVAATITLIFGGSAAALAVGGEDRRLFLITAASAFSAPIIILRLARPELLDPPAWAGSMLLAASGPAALVWIRGAVRRHVATDGLPFPAGAALLLIGTAASDLVPNDWLGGAWLLLAAGAALAGRRIPAAGFASYALLIAGLAILWSMAMVPEYWVTLAASLAGEPALASNLPGIARALVILLVPVPLLLLVRRELASGQRIGTVLLAAAALFMVSVLYILFKQVFGLAGSEDFVARGFAERLLITQALFLAGWLLGVGHLQRLKLDGGAAARIGAVLTGLAAARLVWFDMLLHNPVRDAQWVGSLPVLNLLLPAYLGSACWLYGYRRRAGSEAVSGAWLTLFLAALVLGVALMVRQLFHGAILTAPTLSSAESYIYSLAGLILSIGLLLSGIKLPDKALRLAGLILLTATIFKVFLIDASALEGLLRILSFLGLGLALIGIGKLYATVLKAEAGTARNA